MSKTPPAAWWATVPDRRKALLELLPGISKTRGANAKLMHLVLEVGLDNLPAGELLEFAAELLKRILPPAEVGRESHHEKPIRQRPRGDLAQPRSS